MKKIILTMLFAVAFGFAANAESSIYMFLRSVGNSDTKVYVDGKEVADLNGPVKKTMPAGWGLAYPLVLSEPCYRKIDVNGEGKVVVSITSEYKNPMNGNITNFKAEYPLEIEDGESYYLELTNKGLSDMKINELKEKAAVKKMKKFKELPTITVK